MILVNFRNFSKIFNKVPYFRHLGSNGPTTLKKIVGPFCFLIVKSLYLYSNFMVGIKYH